MNSLTCEFHFYSGHEVYRSLLLFDLFTYMPKVGILNPYQEYISQLVTVSLATSVNEADLKTKIPRVTVPVTG